MIELIKGNRKRLVLKLFRDGSLITDLSTATSIEFAIKKKAEDTNARAVLMIVDETGDPDARVERNQPCTGCVRLTLDSEDTLLDPGEYFYALQCSWGTDDDEEWTFDDGKLKVVTDVIR